jgi:hypothetical protein
MAISYPLTAPASPVPRSIRPRAKSVVAVTQSPFTLTQETQVWPGQNWEVDVSLPPMKRPDAEAWLAFLLSLNGMEGTFLFGFPTSKTPRGPAAGSPVADGTQSAGARTLATKGWTANQSPVLRAGDFIQLGTSATTRLHKVLVDANADGSGLASLEIFPGLRGAGIANNAAIATSNCLNLWRLASNVTDWDVDVAQIYGLQFSAMGVV